MAEYLTPLQQQDGVSADQTFVDEAGAFVASAGIEGKKDSPYLDDKGIPTVGIGINLNAYWRAYLDELEIDRNGPEGQALANVFKGTYQKITGYDDNGKPVYARDDDAFQSTLASAMQPYGGVDNLKLYDAKIQHLYDSVVLGDVDGNDPNGDPAKLAKFKQFLDGHGISRELLTSREGVAIFSLYFNNAGKLLPPTGHLVPDLKATSDAGFANRADAWFQIRYNSNSGSLTVSDPSGGQSGTAKRRDEESTIFGLYDAGDVAGDGTVMAPLKEALAIYADLSENTNGTRPHADGTKSKLADQLGVLTNRQYAFKYEYRYER